MPDSMLVCPRCDEPMTPWQGLVGRQFVFVVLCERCPLITEILPTHPPMLMDFGAQNMHAAEDFGIQPTPITRTAVPFVNWKES